MASLAVAARPRPRARAPTLTIGGTQLFHGGHADAKGKRKTMEDRSSIVGCFAGPGTQYYGIFDGHGGGDCSTYVSQTLHELIARRIEANVDVKAAIQDAIDEANLFAQQKWSVQGTTVAIAVVVEDKLYAANVGDSRVVLVDGDGVARRLSYDHKVSDQTEYERIVQRGGCIINGRVGGSLELSRTVGDGAYAGMISCEAYIVEVDYRPEQKLILGCDGIWNVLSDQEAADIFMHSETPSVAAKEIIKESFNRFTDDNVAVVCVDLNPITKSEPSGEQSL